MDMCVEGMGWVGRPYAGLGIHAGGRRGDPPLQKRYAHYERFVPIQITGYE